jgi:hypothetical protein
MKNLMKKEKLWPPFLLFVVIAIKQFVKMSVYDVPYFQADSILLIGAKY